MKWIGPRTDSWATPLPTSWKLKKELGSGVAQETVLGPILFIFYINNITDAILPSFIPKLYADDLKAYNYLINDKEGKSFNEILNKISEWAEWQLPISTEKLKWLSISNKHRSQQPNLLTHTFKLANADLL